MLHYTDDSGYKAISSQPVWRFRVSKPPGDHPAAAYFTTLGPGTRNLAIRLRVPRSKLEYVFAFNSQEGLRPLEGGRGQYIFWSPVDYNVDRPRQVYNGATERMP
jgi:hypothetical protein